MLNNFLFLKKINFLIFRSYLQDLIVFLIVIFSFFVSFDSYINKILLKFMIIIWLLSLLFKNTVYFFKNNRLFFYVIIFSFWVFITCVFTFELGYPYEGFLKYFLLPILIISTSLKREYIKYVLGAFIFGMFINEVISYGIYFEIIQSKFLSFKIVGDKTNPIPFMPSHMEYTLFLSLAIIISLFSIFKVEGKLIKTILVFFTITMTINLFLTTGRTGQFTLLGTLLFLTIIYFRHNYKYITSAFLVIVFIFSMAFSFSNNTNSRLKQGYDDIVKVFKDQNYDSSLGIRLSSYVILPKLVDDKRFNIFYGFGYSKLDKIIEEIHIEEFGINTSFAHQKGHLHNSYITIFAGTGLIGFILFILILYNIFIIRIEEDYLSYVRYSFLFVFILAGFTENIFRQKEVISLFSIFISICILNNRFLEKNKI